MDNREENESSAKRVTGETGVILGIVVLVFCGGVPWLLERWTVQKIDRAHHGCEVLLEALLAYQTDWEQLPQSLNDRTLRIIAGDEDTSSSAERYWRFLTTPRAYLGEIPKSPFRDTSEIRPGYLAAFSGQGSVTDVIAVMSTSPGGAPPDFEPQSISVLWKSTDDGWVPSRAHWYAPSNGVFSYGWIYRDSGGVVSPGG